jgi:hypothetical protein
VFVEVFVSFSESTMEPPANALGHLILRLFGAFQLLLFRIILTQFQHGWRTQPIFFQTYFFAS